MGSACRIFTLIVLALISLVVLVEVGVPRTSSD